MTRPRFLALGKLCRLVNGRAFKPTDWTPEGLPIIRIQNLNDPEKPFNRFSGQVPGKFIVEDGDILLSWSGSFGCFEWRRGRGILNQHIFKVHVDQALVEPRFFLHAVNSKLEEMIALAHGGVGLRHITKGKLESIELPVPALAEQRRIADWIDECLSKLDELSGLRAQGILEAEAVLPAMIRSRLEEASASWPERPLEEFVRIVGGQSLPKGAELDPGDDGVLLFKVGDMNLDGNKLLVSRSRLYASKDAKGRIVPPGTVVIPKRGGAIATNKKRLLARPAILDPNLMGLVPDQDVVTPEYLLGCFENIDLRTLSNGGVIPQLNKKDLAPLAIPLPPIEQQREIVDAIGEVRQAASGLVGMVCNWSLEERRLRTALLEHAVGTGAES